MEDSIHEAQSKWRGKPGMNKQASTRFKAFRRDTGNIRAGEYQYDRHEE